MSEYNASDTRAVRKAAKRARQAEAERDIVVSGLMSSPAGRAYVYELLVRCHIFSSSFSPSALGMAFAEGERNVGLQLLGDVMRCAPDQYTQMMREINDRDIADRRIRDSQNGNGRDKQPDGATGSGDADGSTDLVGADYDPFDDASGGADRAEDGSERGN